MIYKIYERSSEHPERMDFWAHFSHTGNHVEAFQAWCDRFISGSVKVMVVPEVYADYMILDTHNVAEYFQEDLSE